MDISRRSFLAGAASAAAFTGFAGCQWLAAAKARRCNILFIMTDDHAAHAISAYGSRINKTPYMDALAKDGALLTNCLCTNPICAPSRGGILTGMYSHKNGVPTFNAISNQIKTVGGYMKDAGYYTAFLGKWHVGGPGSMRDQDWSRWMIYQNQGQYFDPFFFARQDGFVPDAKAKVTPHGKDYVRVSFPGEYATENLTRMTKNAVDEAIAAGKPFYIMMHHKAPHRNWLPSKKYHAAFRKLTLKEIPIPDTLFDDWKGRASPIRTTAMTLLHHMRPGMDLKLAEYFTEGGKFEFEGKEYFGKKNDKGQYVDQWPEGMDDRARTALSYLRYMQDYLACVQSVDDSVGEMTAYLKEKGLYENTLIVYTADQGFFLGDHGLYDKRFIMQEVVKMPFIACCPALIKPGTVNDDIVSNIDFAPTFLEMAGAEKPAAMQGRSFLSNLEGDTPSDWKKDCYLRYYVEGGEHATAAWYGIQTKTDKLVFYYKRNEWEYFDLVKDPEELNNGYSAPEYQPRIEELRKRLYEIKKELGDEDQYKDIGEYA